MSSFSSQSGAYQSEVSELPPHQRWLSQLKDVLDASSGGQELLEEKKSGDTMESVTCEQEEQDFILGCRADERQHCPDPHQNNHVQRLQVPEPCSQSSPNGTHRSSDQASASRKNVDDPSRNESKKSTVLRGDSDSSEGPLPDDTGDEDLREELRMAENERRVIEGEMEWKEVQWKTQLETLEINHWTALAELKSSKQSEASKMRRDFEDEIVQLRAALEKSKQAALKVPKIKEPESWPNLAASLANSAKSDSSAAPEMTPESSPGLLAGLVHRLRCPGRRFGFAKAEKTSNPGDVGSDSGGGAQHCQAVSWEIVRRMPGVTALLCSLPDLVVQQATPEACKIWGSANLHGELLLRLVTSPTRGAALQKALNDNPPVEEVPGFCIKDCRCMELRNNNGQNFDASITAIRLPPEPGLQKAAIGIVIIDVFDANLCRKQDSEMDCRLDPDGRSMVSASDVSVTPSDSISCIHTHQKNRHGGSYARRGSR